MSFYHLFRSYDYPEVGYHLSGNLWGWDLLYDNIGKDFRKIPFYLTMSGSVYAGYKGYGLLNPNRTGKLTTRTFSSKITDSTGSTQASAIEAEIGGNISNGKYQIFPAKLKGTDHAALPIRCIVK